jgi:hypothetical protein
MRSLLIATTCFAVWCVLVSQFPGSLSQLLIGAVWFLATGWLAVGLVFGRGDQRAFCIGALLVVSSMWTGLGGQYLQGFHSLFLRGLSDSLTAWLKLAMIAATAVANGWFCVRARRFFEPPSGG